MPAGRSPGWLTATEGEVIDLDYLERDIIGDDRPGAAGDIARFAVREIAFDPWQASLIVPHLQATGVPCVEVRPTVANFSEPMKELEALVLQGRFHHPADPVLTWMISNVVCHHDARDNIYPTEGAAAEQDRRRHRPDHGAGPRRGRVRRRRSRRWPIRR